MIQAILLFLLLLICTITDIRERRIYNKVLLPFLIIAFLVNGITSGWDGLEMALFGTFVGFGILLIPYLMGGMGAGDVKLLAVIGALMGAKFVALSAIYMAIAGGLFALLIIAVKKSPKQLIKNLFFSLIGRVNGFKIPVLIDKDSMKATYPYGVAIAAGAVIQFFRAGMLL
ncbi:A24 family peptidase [Bacillus sp. EB01]|uniref:A24 family peptidase n=1 Tax=Bacillus sp. EB01 TaxID=1347086 RepID=UPI0005C6DF97|nr:prepilin peptidase [Bacillus sp. EB01]